MGINKQLKRFLKYITSSTESDLNGWFLFIVFFGMISLVLFSLFTLGNEKLHSIVDNIFSGTSVYIILIVLFILWEWIYIDELLTETWGTVDDENWKGYLCAKFIILLLMLFTIFFIIMILSILVCVSALVVSCILALITVLIEYPKVLIWIIGISLFILINILVAIKIRRKFEVNEEVEDDDN